MLKRAFAVAAGVVLALGGLTAAGKWHDHRVAVCEQRRAALAAIDLFQRPPDGFRPAEPYSGCHSESVVAFAGWRFASTGGPGRDALADRVAVDVDEQAVSSTRVTARPSAATRQKAAASVRRLELLVDGQLG